MITRYRERIVHFCWHYHSEIELAWIRKGNGLRYVGHSVEPFQSGDLVLLGRNLPHTWCSARGQKTDAEWIVVQFDPQRWGDVFWQMPELKELRGLLRAAERGVHYVGAELQSMGHKMETLAACRPYSFEALALFIDLCQHLLRAPYRSLNNRSITSSADQLDPRLQKVLARTDEFAGGALSQADIAALVKMDPATFCRWFKARMGRNFGRYLNEVRVARVCAKLADSEESITSVAMDCGFNNLANFNRRFLEIMGMTPRQFRSQTKGPRAPVSNLRQPGG
jgi:AraC-like DNA-binding protein